MQSLFYARKNMNEEQDISLCNSFLMKNFLPTSVSSPSSPCTSKLNKSPLRPAKKKLNNSRTLFEEFLITESENPPPQYGIRAGLLNCWSFWVLLDFCLVSAGGKLKKLLALCEKSQKPTSSSREWNSTVITTSSHPVQFLNVNENAFLTAKRRSTKKD